ncbi:MAG: hypothetical protein IH892_23150, partial [Planctomycetes bacterium]|nr:hypothetical protein [Planctomycetota bacterium]
MEKKCIIWVSMVSVSLLQSSLFAQLPAGWIEQSGWLSGSFGPDAGNATVDAETIEVSGGGPDIWATSDGGQFLLREASGNGEIIARCLDTGTGSNAWAKGGIMIRNTLAANGAHAHVLMTGGNGGGGILQWRLTDGGGSAWPGDTIPAVQVPKWLKVERIGDEFSGYFSDDGSNWTQTGPTQTIAMTDPVYVGFAVSSHQNGELRTFVFDSLESSWFSFKTATAPSPEDEAIDIPRDVVLGWASGELANRHTVFFGTVFDDVNNASTTDPLGVRMSPNQSVNTYDPNGLLDFGQTYYWRVDEVNSAPDFTAFKGDVWRFTAEPFSIPITGIAATASSSFGASTPEKTIDGSGLAEDLHDTSATHMWISGGVPATIEYAFDRAYKLHELWLWNSNQLIEAFVGFGAKDVVIEHSLDGENWSVLDGVGPLVQATGTEGYAHNNTIDFGGAVAQHVRLTIDSVQGIAPQASLSEVRFFFIPTFATRPNPAPDATDVAPDTTLSWGRNGREADRHEIYVGTNANDLALAGAASESSFSTGALDLQLGQTYSWRVDEVNEAMDPSTWEGTVWSFTTVDAIIIDDMESYKDEEFL